MAANRKENWSPENILGFFLAVDLCYNFPMPAFSRYNPLHNSSVLKVFNISGYPTARYSNFLCYLRKGNIRIIPNLFNDL